MNQLKNATDREKGILFKYLIDKNINNNSLNILEYILDNNNNNQGFNKIAQNKLDRLLYHKNSLEDDKKLLASMLIKKGINIDNFDDALKITDILNKDTTKEPEKTILQNIAKNTVSKFNNKLTELITKIINSQDITKDNLINSYNLNKNESYRYAFIDYLFSKKDENATYITALKEIITKEPIGFYKTGLKIGQIRYQNVKTNKVNKQKGNW